MEWNWAIESDWREFPPIFGRICMGIGVNFFEIPFTESAALAHFKQLIASTLCAPPHYMRITKKLCQNPEIEKKKRIGSFELGVGPNLVRVRKFEILYRIFEVRRSSKFENKFTNLIFSPF